MRELISTVVAVVVIILSRGNGPLGILAWFAVWLIWPERKVRTSAERRYRMRETEKRNQAIANDWRVNEYDSQG